MRLMHPGGRSTIPAPKKSKVSVLANLKSAPAMSRMSIASKEYAISALISIGAKLVRSVM